MTQSLVFSMFITKSKTNRIGYTISPAFDVTLHIRDLTTLKSIQIYFNGIGNITIKEKSASYRVRTRTDLRFIIENFTKYPFKTSKLYQFHIFVKIYNLLEDKVHVNIAGFLKVAALANQLNHPLSDSLLTDLSLLVNLPYVKLEQPVLNNNPELEPFWVSGFIFWKKSKRNGNSKK